MPKKLDKKDMGQKRLKNELSDDSRDPFINKREKLIDYKKRLKKNK